MKDKKRDACCAINLFNDENTSDNISGYVPKNNNTLK